MGMIAGLLTAIGSLSPAIAAEGKRIEIKGELIDTWFYFSGVMGGPDAVIVRLSMSKAS